MNIITTIVHEPIIYREVFLLEEVCLNLKLKYLSHIINCACTFSLHILILSAVHCYLKWCKRGRAKKNPERREKEGAGSNMVAPFTAYPHSTTVVPKQLKIN